MKVISMQPKIQTKIRKAIFPVAGMGTRLLPQTKVVPKEMLPILDKPIIQYAVEEAIEAEIEEFIFVSSKGKNAIEDHFDAHPELVSMLQNRSKVKELKILEDMSFTPGQVAVVRQPYPLGLGHAVWCARHLIDDDYFAVLLPDDVIMHKISCLAQMSASFAKKEGAYAAIMDVKPSQIHLYGAIATDLTQDKKALPISNIVEKPKKEEAPSNLAVIGRYILPKSIFKILEQTPHGAGGEIQLTDALKALIGQHPFYGHVFEGARFDCGTKLGLVEANIAFGLQQDDIKDDLKKILKHYGGI